MCGVRRGGRPGQRTLRGALPGAGDGLGSEVAVGADRALRVTVVAGVVLGGEVDKFVSASIQRRLQEKVRSLGRV